VCLKHQLESTRTALEAAEETAACVRIFFCLSIHLTFDVSLMAPQRDTACSRVERPFVPRKLFRREWPQPAAFLRLMFVM
jgi:hypothetical protein